MEHRRLNIFIPILLFLFLSFLIIHIPGFGWDTRGAFMQWAWYIRANGLRNAYGSDTNYMPVYQYVLWLFAKINGTDKAISDNLPYLRCFTLAFDFAGLWYVYKWIDRKTDYFILLIICILNVAYSYDSLIWGQVDGILSSLVFISLFYAYKGDNLWSAVWLVLAFNFKIQTIVILPVWGLLFIYNSITGKSWKNIVVPLVAGIATQGILLLPFLTGRYEIRKIFSIVIDSFGFINVISIKASNFWQYLGPERFTLSNDSAKWVGGFTYKEAGMIFFFIASFFTLLPLMMVVFKRWKTGNEDIRPARELIWLTGAMVYLLFYFFNTEIHERYCQPAFIFITAYAFFTGDFLAYILFSIMYFLTLEHEMRYLDLANYDTFIFDLRFLAAINIIIIGYLGNKMYRVYKSIGLPAGGEPLRTTA